MKEPKYDYEEAATHDTNLTWRGTPRQRSLPKSKEEIEYMKSLPLDEYARWMLENRYYDVDVETGAVVNLRTGKNLQWVINRSGYPFVQLTFSQKVQRPVRVHRLIAVKFWGVAAIIGKQIAHLDHDKMRCTITNLSPKTPKEHVLYDGTHAHPKEYWPPCVRCEDKDGPIMKWCKTPTRVSGKIFGIDGQICFRCYQLLHLRMRRAIKKSQQSTSEESTCEV